jgi:hypothetical protein
MRLPAAHYIPGPKCTCSAKPILDPLGLHVTSGCGKDGYRHQIHHIISLELVSLLRYSSFHTVREERNLFRTGSVDANERPDITIKNSDSLPDDIKGIANQGVNRYYIPCPCERYYQMHYSYSNHKGSCIRKR